MAALDRPLPTVSGSSQKANRLAQPDSAVRCAAVVVLICSGVFCADFERLPGCSCRSGKRIGWSERFEIEAAPSKWVGCQLR
jgi:hypothetical protein